MYNIIKGPLCSNGDGRFYDILVIGIITREGAPPPITSPSKFTMASSYAVWENILCLTCQGHHIGHEDPYHKSQYCTTVGLKIGSVARHLYYIP